MGALLIARRRKDARHQRAVRNFRWLLGTGLGGYLAIMGARWMMSYMDRQQVAAEARDAALVTAMAEVAEQLKGIGEKEEGLSKEIVSMRSLAIGAKKLPDCPPCICKPPPAAACSPVIVFPEGGRDGSGKDGKDGKEGKSPPAPPLPYKFQRER